MRPTIPLSTLKSRRFPRIGASVAVVVVVAGVFALTRLHGSTATPLPATPHTVQSTPAVEPAGASRAPAVPRDTATPTKNSPKTEVRPPAETRSANAKAEPKKAEAKPTAQELELFRTLQTSALDSRRRAADAGATASQLQAGDDQNKAAVALVEEGKVTDAASRISAATNAWVGAEREARAATAAAAAVAANKTKAAVTDAPKPDPVPVQPPAAATLPAQRPAPPNPSIEISSLISAYARAIESRNVAEVRRAYPGATAAQLKGFDEFFGTVRSLRASFAVTSLDVNGTSAEAHLTGAYDYVTNTGETKRQPLGFQASFRRDAGAWKLMSVR